jgi:hypothetical protein
MEVLGLCVIGICIIIGTISEERMPYGIAWVILIYHNL